MKICKHCKKEKELSEFPRDKYTKDGYTTRCKTCRYSKTNEWAKKNYEENKEAVLEAHAEWRRANWAKVYKQRKESGYCKRSRKKWYDNKAKHNINHVLKERLRRRTRRAIQEQGSNKHLETMELLGCSINQLKTHLESKFTTGMTWDNYGEWHIDHIKPCASFDLTDPEQQKLCFHYLNLQPLWALENLRKSSKDS